MDGSEKSNKMSLNNMNQKEFSNENTKEHRSAILSFLSLILVSLFWESNLLLLVLLIIIAILILSINKSKVELIVFLFCGFSGMFAEAIAIYFGVWKYANASFLDVPIWLPVLWGIASVSIIITANFVASKLNK